MKTAALDPNYYNRRPVKARPYPNAADKRLTAEKAVNFLLCAAISVSVVTALLFILALG